LKKFSRRAQAREVAAKLKLKSSPMVRVLAAIHTWRDMDGSKSATMFMFFETSIIRRVCYNIEQLRADGTFSGKDRHRRTCCLESFRC